MPPKKKGKGGKGKGGGGGGAGAAAFDAKAREATMAMFHQLDQDKINTLTARFDEVMKEKHDLRRMVDKGERETHEFVSYFQTELEKKDDTITNLRDRVSELEQTSADEIARLKAECDAKVSSLVEDRGKSEVETRARLKVLEDELQKLDAFRETKMQMEAEIKKLEDTIEANDQEHKQQTTNQERKFLAEKLRMQREFELRTEEWKAGEREKVEQGLDTETKRIQLETKRLREELRFQQEVTEELKLDKEKLEASKRRLQRDVDILQEKEREYARQGSSKSKELHALHDKVEVLESMLREAGRKFAGERAKFQQSVRKDMEEQSLDVAGLRQLVKLKNRELQQIRTHARTILEQRTEVEQFFLEALEQCKKNIIEERQRAYRAAVANYRAKMKRATLEQNQEFPSIKTRQDLMFAQSMTTSQLPVSPSTKVQLADLTWADREKVLRLLFAKINAVQRTVRNMPEHPLQTPPTQGGNPFVSQGAGLPPTPL